MWNMHSNANTSSLSKVDQNTFVLKINAPNCTRWVEPTR